jgi:hypothetical protein
MGFEEKVRQQRLHLAQVGRDLFVAAVFVGPRRRQLKPIERAFSGQRFAAIPFSGTILSGGIVFSGEHGHQRIVPQLVVVDEVFVAQREAVNSLGDQFGDGVFDEFRVTVIGKALGESRNDPRFRLDFPQQQATGIGSDVSAIENPDEFPLFEGLKTESIRVTLCLHWVVSCLRRNLLLSKQVIAQEAAQRNTTW